MRYKMCGVQMIHSASQPGGDQPKIYKNARAVRIGEISREESGKKLQLLCSCRHDNDGADTYTFIFYIKRQNLLNPVSSAGSKFFFFLTFFIHKDNL